MAELLQMINHEHPLLFNDDTSSSSSHDNTYHCFGCTKEVSSAPSYSCGDCGLYLHKECAEAPSEIHHPVHGCHPFLLGLLQPSDDLEIKALCSFCNGEQVGGCIYSCSCELFLHINCALLPRDSTGDSSEILHFADRHPLISKGSSSNFRYCHGCWGKLTDDSYDCMPCGTSFHKKCLELPTEINHPCHRKHQLSLIFFGARCRGGAPSCDMCLKSRSGFFYLCLPCCFIIHAYCAWPPPIIEDKSRHPHPFTLLLRPNNPFHCNACGRQGNHVSYICSPCNIQVHKDCISLPLHVRLTLHPHPISHNFFLRIDHRDSRTWDCRICYEKVNVENGSYCCSRSGCDFVIHVKCSTKRGQHYHVVEVENPDESEQSDCLYEPKSCIIRTIKKIKVENDVLVEEIEHVSHEHNLIFSEEIVDNKYCNGCVLPILSSFYCCSRCDFFLHKACAELPKMRKLWFDAKPFNLLTGGIFKCQLCLYECSGFSYKLSDCDGIYFCIRCASISHAFAYQADKPHYIFYDSDHRGKCNACGKHVDIENAYKCKDCTFLLHMKCVIFPRTVRHKCDEHYLTLTHRDINNYPIRYYCDICEEEKDPQQWFYRCETCDNDAHIKCVLEEYTFIKAGCKYTYKDHPHTLTFVKKSYYYPQCVLCGRPCRDLALECEEHACKYIVHWRCIKPSDSEFLSQNGKTPIICTFVEHERFGFLKGFHTQF